MTLVTKVLFVLVPLLGSNSYTYEQDLTRLAALERKGFFYLGKLDAVGNFTEERTLAPLAVNSPYSGPHFRELNWPRRNDERVYEYRSGRLIRGRWNEEGSFVPDLGAKVIEFGEYKYSSEAPRIYNLPGRFVKYSPAG